MVVCSQRLDSVILEVFSNYNDSMILYFWFPSASPYTSWKNAIDILTTKLQNKLKKKNYYLNTIKRFFFKKSLNLGVFFTSTTSKLVI